MLAFLYMPPLRPSFLFCFVSRSILWRTKSKSLQGELTKLENRWWYGRSECKNSPTLDQIKEMKTSLTLNNVAGCFFILIGGLAISLVVASVDLIIRCVKEAHREKVGFFISFFYQNKADFIQLNLIWLINFHYLGYFLECVMEKHLYSSCWSTYYHSFYKWIKLCCFDHEMTFKYFVFNYIKKE